MRATSCRVSSSGSPEKEFRMDRANVFPLTGAAAAVARPARESRAASDRGAWQHIEGDLAGARATYESAIEADPANATAHNNLGFLLMQQGDLEAAIASFERALSIDPAKSTALANL